MADLFIFALIITFILGVCIGLAYAEIRQMRARIAALETAQAKRLPYQTADEIEDATAAILAAKFKSDFHADMLDNALAHLQKARNGNAK